MIKYPSSVVAVNVFPTLGPVHLIFRPISAAVGLYISSCDAPSFSSPKVA